MWSGKDVSYDHLRVFVFIVFVHIPKDERTKLDVKTRHCIFISYGIDESGYKFYDPIDKKMIQFVKDQTLKNVDNAEKPVVQSSDDLSNLDKTMVEYGRAETQNV